MPRSKTSLIVAFFLFLLFTVGTAAAEQLAQIRVSGLDVRLNTVSNDYELVIKPVGGVESLSTDLTAHVFAIENPTRLVVDIPGFRSRSAQTVNITDNLFRSLRLGVHKDKIRLVLDVIGIDAPGYEIRSDPQREALVVSIQQDGGTFLNESQEIPGSSKRHSKPQEAVVSELTDERAPEPPSVFEQSPRPPSKPVQEQAPDTFEEADEGLSQALAAVGTMRGEKKMLPVEEPQIFEDPEESSSIQPAKPEQPRTGQAMVKGIYYHTAKNTGASAVMIEVENLDVYQLSQKEPNRFELVLKNTNLSGNHLTLPQFPPDTFSGFEVILARPQGADTIVSIYVDQNVRQISPSKIRDKLWLKPVFAAK